MKRPACFKQNELAWVTAGIYREFLYRDEVSRLAIEGAVLNAIQRVIEAVKTGSTIRPLDANH